MQDSAFQPKGPCYYVDSTAWVNCPATTDTPTSYRVYAVSGASPCFGYAPNNGGIAPPSSLTVASPTLGAPAANTACMPTSAVEVFTLPANGWFRASAGCVFNFIPGEGV